MRDPLHWSADPPDGYTHPAGYRIVVGQVGSIGRQAPVYWCHHGHAFIGAAGGERVDACALCADHAEGKFG